MPSDKNESETTIPPIYSKNKKGQLTYNGYIVLGFIHTHQNKDWGDPNLSDAAKIVVKRDLNE